MKRLHLVNYWENTGLVHSLTSVIILIVEKNFFHATYYATQCQCVITQGWDNYFIEGKAQDNLKTDSECSINFFYEDFLTSWKAATKKDFLVQ